MPVLKLGMVGMVGILLDPHPEASCIQAHSDPGYLVCPWFVFCELFSLGKHGLMDVFMEWQ